MIHDKYFLREFLRDIYTSNSEELIESNTVYICYILCMEKLLILYGKILEFKKRRVNIL